MTIDDHDALVLERALDQLATLLSQAGPDTLTNSTPCEEWTVRELVDHIVDAPAKFGRMVRNEPVDWSAPNPPAGDSPASAFRVHGDALLNAWRHSDDTSKAPPVDWQCAELAVHTWDLATALGHPTADLDPEVAEHGLAFMRASLKDADRGPAFGPAQPAPEDADVYTRLAAFAGRSV